MFTRIGNLARSAQGWAFLVLTVIPTAWAVVSSYLDRLNWTERTIAVMAVLLIGLLCTWAFLHVWEKTFAFFDSRQEQKRIAKDLNRYLASGLDDYIDLPTAAAIWSGSRED